MRRPALLTAFFCLLAASLPAAAPQISKVSAAPAPAGFTVEWTTDQPASSAVFDAAGKLLAADERLVTHHHLDYSCAVDQVCTVTCRNETDDCVLQCQIIEAADCVIPAVVGVRSENEAGEVTSDTRGGYFYLTHTPVLVGWREIL